MTEKLNEIEIHTYYMSLTFPHYERARVHPCYKTVQDMILGGPTLPFYSANCFFILYNFFCGSNLAVL